MRFSVTFDAADHEALAGWWAETLGWERQATSEEMSSIRPPEAERHEDHILFMKVPEPKSAKNRVHLDLHPEGDTRAYLSSLIARGATLIEERGPEWPVQWATLADPEGNEFCVVLGRSE